MFDENDQFVGQMEAAEATFPSEPDPVPEFKDGVDPKTGEIKPAKKADDKKVVEAAKPAPAAKPATPAPANKQSAPVGSLQALLLKKKNALENFLGNEHNALRFMSSVMHSMDKIPALRECSGESLLGAFMECAALGLYPGTHSGDCYVLPYAGKAQFQLGYRGLKTLAYRAGILSCGTDIVCENDSYKEYRGTNPRIEHNVPLKGERGKPYRAYAWAEVTPGKFVFKSMSEADIMKIKKLSQAAGSKYSPWNSGNDPELWMWQKTAWKQLAKMLPTSEKLDRAVYLDNVSERGGYIEDEGTVIEAAFGADSDVKIELGKDRKEQMRKGRK